MLYGKIEVKIIWYTWIITLLLLLTGGVSKADIIDDVQNVVVAFNKIAYRISDKVNLKYEPLDNVEFSFKPKPIKSIGKGQLVYEMKVEVTF